MEGKNIELPWCMHVDCPLTRRRLLQSSLHHCNIATAAGQVAVFPLLLLVMLPSRPLGVGISFINHSVYRTSYTLPYALKYILTATPLKCDETPFKLTILSLALNMNFPKPASSTGPKPRV